MPGVISKQKFLKRLLAIFILQLLTGTAFAQRNYEVNQESTHTRQTHQKVEKLHKEAARIYSTDDLLVNGQVYTPTKSLSKGSPYYGENQFVAGKIIVRGRAFTNQLLKYNLQDQRLILRAPLESGKYVTIQLNPDMVDEFWIDHQRFINMHNYYGTSKSSFYALVYSGRFDFLVQYKKTFQAVYNQQTPHGSFSNTFANYFIFTDGKLVDLPTRKALFNYFAGHKKEIKQFMRKHKIRYKKAHSDALYQLMNYCDSISTH